MTPETPKFYFRLPRSFLLSLGVHFLLIGLAVLYGYLHPWIHEKPETPRLEVQIVDSPTERSEAIATRDRVYRKPLPKAGSHPEKHRARRSQEPTKDLSRLGVPIPGLSKQEPLSDTSHGQNSDEDSQPEGDLLSGTGFRGGDGLKVAKDKNITLYKYLYETIEKNLTYPSEFVDRGFQGTVIAKLCFNQKGEYLRECSEFQSPNNFLKVHLTRVLRRALADPPPEIFKKPAKRHFVNCSFRFHITQNGDHDLVRAKKFISGNNLFFYRSFYRSKLEWELGPLSGLGPFASFNPLWLVQKGSDIFSKKAKIDPLEKYRDDPEW